MTCDIWCLMVPVPVGPSTIMLWRVWNCGLCLLWRDIKVFQKKLILWDFRKEKKVSILQILYETSFFNFSNLHPIQPMNLLHSLEVISSPNESKMADALSPSQIHILFGDGEAEKKPIRTRWQLFLLQMRVKCPMPCPHHRSTFYSEMERQRRNQLNSCMRNLLPA